MCAVHVRLVDVGIPGLPFLLTSIVRVADNEQDSCRASPEVNMLQADMIS
jgi:hypothetical protein